MIRITCVRKSSHTPEGNPHLAITSFAWINEQTQVVGESSRAAMYDWIVNKKGVAYIRDKDGNNVYVFGAVSPQGSAFLRTIKDQKWTDDLLTAVPNCT